MNRQDFAELAVGTESPVFLEAMDAAGIISGTC